MNDYELDNLRETFSRLFVLAVRNKINFKSFTNMLSKSSFITAIEKDKYNELFNKPIEQLLFSITGFETKEDNSYGIYNDAYWCGQNYFDLHIKTKKPFVYLFLKLPFEEMMNIYSIYHEMDFSSLVDYFHKKEKEKTILRILCEERRCSLNDLCKATSLSLNTLRKYNSSDDILYNASFQNIIKLIEYFDVSYLLFKE
ncbi:MAG: helix-turn-helix transcriptional regulator [Bacilli bacterium]|nr:helix-turn-helix transcriptional regulator [Bacilli bacterium]